ncbi:sensor histidine kinase [Spirosoma utsteinense]|uniref:histidine kinase n=1 Tax=Spirosoma utsteinense TaxID=2585773 RepID=A0ABR6WBX8_9BACT|nr:7TM-DISM domain-containing protein [Spirosoma utsteinense]MBC3784196.1 signal transduction histidine kinase [Spirosoma utsteinense]MBC3794018.1 signal transduction histidine kinase [Spirosoma utsteinense]
MIRNLSLLFVGVVAAFLGLATYHLRSISALPEQATIYSHWEDTGGHATVQDVVRISESTTPAAFMPIRERRINFGYTESIHWFRFRLVADRATEELTFEIRDHTIDRLELFELRNGQITSLGKTGSRLPFAQRPSPTKTFAYLLNVETGQQADYFLRLDKRYENLATELTLWRTSDFEDREQRAYFLWGLFCGVIGLVVGLSFLFYLTTKDPLYGYFGLYILGLALRQFADSGLGFQFLWPGVPAINQPDPVIEALWLYLPATLLFQQHFLELRTESKRAFWATQVFKYAFFTLFIGLVIGQLTGVAESYAGANQLIRQIHTVMAIGCLFVIIGNTVVGLRSVDTVKRLYGIGFGIQIAGQLVVLGQNMMSHQRGSVFLVEPYLISMVVFFIDLVVFLYLLAYRYRKSLDEQRRLQIGLAQTRQHTNEAIIDVLESERQQVGALILTDVGGRLTQTRSLLSTLAPAPLLTEALGLIDKTDACLEQILRDSLPADLRQQGLPMALAELVRQRSQVGTVQLSFAYENDSHAPELTITQTQQLYRIANELINNALKHAYATECRVVFRQDSGHWQLTISDNGQGFDTNSAPNQGGIGLKNLQARAQTLGATLTLTSDKNGTVVHVAG